MVNGEPRPQEARTGFEVERGERSTIRWWSRQWENDRDSDRVVGIGEVEAASCTAAEVSLALRLGASEAAQHLFRASRRWGQIDPEAQEALGRFTIELLEAQRDREVVVIPAELCSVLELAHPPFDHHDRLHGEAVDRLPAAPARLRLDGSVRLQLPEGHAVLGHPPEEVEVRADLPVEDEAEEERDDCTADQVHRSLEIEQMVRYQVGRCRGRDAQQEEHERRPPPAALGERGEVEGSEPGPMLPLPGSVGLDRESCHDAHDSPYRGHPTAEVDANSFLVVFEAREAQQTEDETHDADYQHSGDLSFLVHFSPPYRG